MPNGRRGPSKDGGGSVRPTRLILRIDVDVTKVLFSLFDALVSIILFKFKVSLLTRLEIKGILILRRWLILKFATERVREALEQPNNAIIQRMQQVVRVTGSLSASAKISVAYNKHIHIFFDISYGIYAKAAIDLVNDPAFIKFCNEYVQELLQNEFISASVLIVSSDI